jgi:hypothetical protein
VSTTQTTTADAGGTASWQPPSRAVRWAAYATPLCVLPSAVWRIWYVFVDGDPDCVGHGPAWERPYILSLSVLSVTAAFLTVGLVRPWGEVVPGWVPLVGGRPVPLQVATGAAAAGATLIFTVYTYAVLNGIFHWREGRRVPGCPPPDQTDGAWLAYLCYAPLLLWGPLLVAVTVAYYRRRTRASQSRRRSALTGE